MKLHSIITQYFAVFFIQLFTMKTLLWLCSMILVVGITFAANSPVLELFEENEAVWNVEVLADDAWKEIGRERVVPRPIPKSATIASLPEEYVAVHYLFTIGATKYASVDNFLGDNSITREQAAKLLVKRATQEEIEKKVSVSCDFTDIGEGQMDESLRASVLESCELGIFRGFNNKFSPQSSLIRGHFFLAVLRILWHDVPETWVYEKAKEVWLTTVTRKNFAYDATISRTDASLILRRAAQKRSDLEEFLKSPRSDVSLPLPRTWGWSDDLSDILADLYGDSAETESLSLIWASIASKTTSWSARPSSWTPLKWGEVDDNVLFEDFVEYYEEAQEKFGDAFTKIDVWGRFYLHDAGKSWVLGGTMLRIMDSEGKEYLLSLDNDGEYYFYPSSYYDADDQVNADQYTVSFEYAWVSYEETYSSTQAVRELPPVSWSVNTEAKKLQLAFVIDTTGSMSDQINKIKETIQSVSQRVKEWADGIDLEYGLVAYKDRSDRYLTSSYQFTDDLEAYQTYLDKLSAQWGGDYEEDMNAWLEEAMEFLQRSDEQDTYWILILVADAPPHMDYKQSYDYRVAMLRAVEQGVKIFPLASSGLDNTVGELIFRQIALITNATYIFITKGANGGTDFHVDEQSYSVESLDDLVVDIVLREIQE